MNARGKCNQHYARPCNDIDSKNRKRNSNRRLSYFMHNESDRDNHLERHNPYNRSSDQSDVPGWSKE
jgi:hypothetical protein